ncbi:PASTA domain-containing protein [Desulfococcaceae bacterium HSG7]|nr:PASTA domain-containing protein [Desulfococcaceae bacterium HSG7]
MFFRFLKIIALFLIFGVVTGVCAYLTLTFIIKSEDTVVVPDVVGKEVVHTLKTLSDLELNTKVRKFEYNATITANHVIFQEPEAGTVIKKGRDVRLIISKGTQTIRMPNLKNLSYRQAQIILETNDLGAGIHSRTYHSEISKDHIMAQTPYPNTTVRRNTNVDLLISLGKRPLAYIMPDLKTMTVSDAVIALEQNNLKLGEIKIKVNKGAPEDVVMRQEPQAGQRVIAQSVVNLLVNQTHTTRKNRDWALPQGVILFRHRIADGYLKRHIRVQLNGFGVANDLIDDYYSPGEEVWVLIPRNSNTTMLFYEDDQLIETRLSD